MTDLPQGPRCSKTTSRILMDCRSGGYLQDPNRRIVSQGLQMTREHDGRAGELFELA